MCSKLVSSFTNSNTQNLRKVLKIFPKFRENFCWEICTFLTEINWSICTTYRKTIRHFQSKERLSTSVWELTKTSLAIMMISLFIPLDTAVYIVCNWKYLSAWRSKETFVSVAKAYEWLTFYIKCAAFLCIIISLP